jgi:Mrr N-terminal domain
MTEQWHTIEVDDAVMTLLKNEAEPFVDTPNSVLRRKLSLGAGTGDETHARGDGVTGAPHRRASTATSRRNGGKSGPRRTRVPAGELLPESEYEVPILRALERRGGRAATREVVKAVGEMVSEKLRPLDLEPISTGGARWENRVQFARLTLVREGLLEKDSPRGVWELSDAGRRRLEKETSSR